MIIHTHTHTCIYIESYGGISIVDAVFPALYTRVYYGYAREKERGGKGSLSMLTTCRVIFFIISACLFYICIKRKCLRTCVPPRDNVGGLCWLLPPPPSPTVESVESEEGDAVLCSLPVVGPAEISSRGRSGCFLSPTLLEETCSFKRLREEELNGIVCLEFEEGRFALWFFYISL